jgi:LPXTG-motif cell wall-anchored protein
VFGRVVRKREKRALVLTSAVALAAALVSPVLISASAQAAPDDGYHGTSSGAGTWSDADLGQMTQDVTYNDALAVGSSGCGGIGFTGVPAGLNVIITDSTGNVSVYGTPTGSGAFDMVITVNCTPGDFVIEFTGDITPAPAATTTTLEPETVAPYDNIVVTAHVTSPSSTPTGFVQFLAGAFNYGAPVAVDANGDAVLSTAFDPSQINTTWGFSAHFVANADYAESFSGQDSILLYGGNGPHGHVNVDGTAVRGATVDLLDSDGDVAATDTTDSSGAYSFDLAISTVSDVVAQYRIRATLPAGTSAAPGTVIYYSLATWPTSPTSILQAESSDALDWTSTTIYDVDYAAPPSWTDSTLGLFQVGTAVHDGVTATGSPVIHYSVSSGSLPDGVQLNTATGALTGTPTSDDSYDFTLTATNDAGHVDQEFQDIVRPATSLNVDPDFDAGAELSDATLFVFGSGLAANSAYTITAHSAPVVLATGAANSLGAFSTTVTLPTDLPAGPHSVVASAKALNGHTVTTTVWFTVKADGTIGAVSLTGPFPTPNAVPVTVLAFTGSDAAVPLEAAAGILLLGAALVLLRRRRRA